jgi:hypothetical protein
VTFSAGQYILNGGGLTIDSASTTVTGSGVSFYNTSSSGYSYGRMTISGQPNVTFSAPTSGTYEGIFWFTDRSQTSTNQNQINGATNGLHPGHHLYADRSAAVHRRKLVGHLHGVGSEHAGDQRFYKLQTRSRPASTPDLAAGERRLT